MRESIYAAKPAAATPIGVGFAGSMKMELRGPATNGFVNNPGQSMISRKNFWRRTFPRAAGILLVLAAFVSGL
jgi:hypothetical protein